MLFESPAPFLRISIYIVLPAVIFTALFFTVTLRLAYKAYKSKPVTGSEGLVGEEGLARTDIAENGGMVSVHGEIWSAYSDDSISKGEKVVVDSVSNLKIKVSKPKGG